MTSVAESLQPLREFGCDYEVHDGRVVAANCAFLEACDQARDPICAVHAGILEGALLAGGIAAAVVPEGPVPPHGCAFRLEVAGASASL